MKKIFTITTILFVFFVFSHPINVFALKLGEIINFNGKNWVVSQMNEDKTVTLCPYYDYDKYFSSSNWGWFYNNKCKKMPIYEFMPKNHRNANPAKLLKKEISDDELVKKVTDPHYLNSLTADEYKKEYARVRNIAVMHPINKNIAAYMYMTNFTRVKALIFSHAVVDYTMKHPKLNMQKKIGQTSWSYDTYHKLQNNAQQSLIEKHKHNLGILVFIKDGCPYCNKQIPILNWFQSDHHIDVLAVSSNYCPNTINIKCVVNPQAFKFYKIQYEPTIILVIRQANGKPKFFPIGVGLTDEVTLFNRAYNFINNYYNPKEQYTDSNLYNLLKEGK